MPKETNKEKALAALLEATSIAEAATLSGLSERTLRRYLAEPEFKEEYRAARRLVYEENARELQQLHGAAVETLRRELGNMKFPAVAVRAALGALKLMRNDFEMQDVLERLEALEDEIKRKDQDD